MAADKSGSALAKLADYSALGMLLPGAIAVGYGIGYLLDKWLGTTYLYMVFLLLGIVAGFVGLIKKANDLFKEK
jgi:F0F1-type ATP synthase assembly protein I